MTQTSREVHDLISSVPGLTATELATRLYWDEDLVWTVLADLQKQKAVRWEYTDGVTRWIARSV